MIRSFSTTIALLTLSLCPLAASVSSQSSHPPNSVAWHHQAEHPIGHLFRRTGALPDIGSPEWSAAYPAGVYKLSQTPQAWTDALSAADSAGLIPDVPVALVPGDPNGDPTYPKGEDPTSPEICSSTYQCRGTDDVWDAADGIIGIGFDDGPLLPSPPLYDFLVSQNQSATHFMIGLNILSNPDIFTQAIKNGDDIAVHTWTHPLMTTLTNEEILAELGWTMQIIHDSTGGKVPRFWRPPYGDADERVRAIAKQVFGLTTIIWNHDSSDWRLTTHSTTVSDVAHHLSDWVNGPKSPGLIILEHELSDAAVQCFINAYPKMLSAGWATTSVARISPGFDSSLGEPYWNAPLEDGANGTVQSMDILDGATATLVMPTAVPQTEAGQALPISTSIQSSLTQTGFNAQATDGGSPVSRTSNASRLWKDESGHASSVLLCFLPLTLSLMMMTL